MEFNIFDMKFKRLGIIDLFSEAEFDKSYSSHGMFFITTDANPRYSDFLINSEDPLIITKSTNTREGYIIGNCKYEDEHKLRIVMECSSLSSMLGWRIIDGQQSFKGPLYEVLTSFVDKNAINPSNPNRIIEDLVILPSEILTDSETEETYSGQDLDYVLWEICKKFEVSYEILMNLELKRFELRFFEGLDLSTEQSENSRVIFSKTFDNVTYQSYVDDISNHRSTAYVVSGGDENKKTQVVVGDELSGYRRKEIFAESSDLVRTYTNEAGSSITVPVAEFENMLKERGKNTLADYKRIQTFESDINTQSQFKYEIHYFLGSIVTTRNDDIGVITHSRVIRVKEKYNREGYSLALEFGTSIPTLIDKIKREVKR